MKRLDPRGAFGVERTSGDTLSLREITTIIFRHKQLITVIFFLVLALVGGFTFLMPKEYESRMKILVKRERPETIVSGSPGSAPDPRTEVSESDINSEIELLNSITYSRRLLLRVDWIAESNGKRLRPPLRNNQNAQASPRNCGSRSTSVVVRLGWILNIKETADAIPA